MSKIFLITFLKLLFLKSFEMPRVFWWALFLLPNCFMVFIHVFNTNMGNMKRGHHYWIILKHKAGWPPKRSFVYLAHYRTLKDHYTCPQLCLSIFNKKYSHHGPYEQNYLCFWPPFDLISMSWALSLNVKVQALESFKKISSIEILQGCTLVIMVYTFWVCQWVFKTLSPIFWMKFYFRMWHVLMIFFSWEIHRLLWAFCPHVSFIDLIISFR